jgi:F-type H+-transporting ATPase subunit delta
MPNHGAIRIMMETAALSKTNHHISSSDRTYALALVELAEQGGQLDTVAEQVASLAPLIQADADLRGLLNTRMLSEAQRTDILKSIFEGRIHDLLYRFIQVVASKGRLGELPQIFHAFARLVDEHRGIVEVEVHVAQPLTEEGRRCVEEGLRRSLKHDIRLRQHVDAALIGGLKIRIGDRLLDASVAAQLRQIENELTDAGRRQARLMMVKQ